MPVKPSKNEQEYFIAQEIARIKALRDEHAKKQAAGERQRLKDLHYLHCPKCGQKMTTTKLSDVEVEICATCGGMYLDAGELGKIIEEHKRVPFAKALEYARKLWKETM
jgi:uncharacterized protein